MFRDHHPSLGTRTAYPLDGTENTSANANVPSASSGKGKQATYTTVGSIYNPHAAVPIQPPTRRPRNRRYPPTVQSPPGESFLGIPNSLLSVLPMTDRVQVSPPPTVKPAPHYSPLQQNYDRAVSPALEEDNDFLSEVPMAVPSIRSGNLPPAILGIGPGAKQSTTPFGDGESVVSEDALVSSCINVKGLTNLASYPNPVQKAAQATLARARATNTVPRLNSPLPIYGATQRATISGASAGTPQPLTAGPPGQRQFRPSTFESTVRALGLDENTPPLVASDSDYLLTAPVGQYATSLAQFFEGDVHVKDRSSTEVYAVDEFDDRVSASEDLLANSFPCRFTVDRIPLTNDKIHTVDLRGGYNNIDLAPLVGEKDLMVPPRGDGALSPASRKVADRLIPYDTEVFGDVASYYPAGPPKDMGTKVQDPYVKRSGPLEMLEEKSARINRSFYSGTEGLGKTMGQIVREHDNVILKNKIGVIGEGRTRARASHSYRAGEGDGGMPLPRLSVEQANITHDSLHAEPLVNLAFATLLRTKEEMDQSNRLGTHGFTGGFIPCNPEWVDDSVDGNRSFFDTSRDDDGFKADEMLKRKRTIKKPRAGRGY